MNLHKEKTVTIKKSSLHSDKPELSSISKTLDTLLKTYENQGYNIQIINRAHVEEDGNNLTVKLRKKGDLTIYMALIPKLDGSKKLSVIKISDGSVIERFMHTKIPPKEPNDIVCPHFLELKWAYGCPFNCAYCYLQGTLRLLPTKKKPMIKELKKVRRHLTAFLNISLNEPELLNTGELCDSLMYEKTEYSITKTLIPLFEDQKINRSKHKILLLSKSDKVEELLKLKNHSHVVTSFSINTNQVARKWEKGAATPTNRIKAASTLSEAGFEVRIRIDPIIPYPKTKWKQQYRSLIDKIFKTLEPSRITLGSLRGLSTTIRMTYDKSWTKYLKEKSKWGLRPPSTIRLQAYKNLIAHLDKEYEYRKVALCKETIEMWNKLNLNWKTCMCNCVP